MVLDVLLCAALNGGVGVLDAALNGGPGIFNATLDRGADVLNVLPGGDVSVFGAVRLLALKGVGGGGTGLPAEDALLTLVGHVGEDAGEGRPEANFSTHTWCAK